MENWRCLCPEFFHAEDGECVWTKKCPPSVPRYCEMGSDNLSGAISLRNLRLSQSVQFQRATLGQMLHADRNGQPKSSEFWEKQVILKDLVPQLVYGKPSSICLHDMLVQLSAHVNCYWSMK